MQLCLRLCDWQLGLKLFLRLKACLNSDSLSLLLDWSNYGLIVGLHNMHRCFITELESVFIPRRSFTHCLSDLLIQQQSYPSKIKTKKAMHLYIWVCIMILTLKYNLRTCKVTLNEWRCFSAKIPTFYTSNIASNNDFGFSYCAFTLCSFEVQKHLETTSGWVHVTRKRTRVIY